MGSRLDPVGLHPLRAVRNLAGAGRRLVRRQIRPAPRRAGRRHPLRHRLGDQRLRHHAQRLLSRHDRRGHRRRRRLRHLRRQRAEMVSRQARPCRRHHRGRFWRRLRAHGRADPGDDQGFRLPGHLPLFRSRPGHHHRASSPSSCSRRKPGQVPAAVAERQRHPEPPQLPADRSDPPADLLADVLHVRDRRRRRIDGHRQPQADRGRLEGRQRSRSR